MISERIKYLGSGNPNPHWFHIAIFPVTAVNPLKIRQYSLRNLLCYRKNCLCETASTCSAEFLQRISVRKGAGGLTPVKTDKPEEFVKIQSTGNAGSGSHCLREQYNYSQSDLADKLGIARTSVLAWENQTSVPAMKHIVELAKLFRVSTDYLLEVESRRTLSLDGLTEDEISIICSLLNYFDTKNP